MNYLIVDVSCLCHRAFYTMKGLSHDGVGTGVVYGFLRTVLDMMTRFNVDDVLFCFDVGKPARWSLFPEYKRKRNDSKKEDPERLASFVELRRQMRLLRRRYLKQIGFKNIHWQKGYEADDMIASLVQCTLTKDDTATIVSSDSDMWQLLRPGVRVFNPATQKMFGARDLFAKHHIRPSQWMHVKCIAGCHSDEVPGVGGVGELTALRFVRDELPSTTKAYQRIKSPDGLRIQERNRALVCLPFKGTRVFKIQPSNPTPKKLRRVCLSLGIKSIEASSFPETIVQQRKRGIIQR